MNVSFPWLPPDLALSNSNVRFCYTAGFIFEKELLKTEDTGITAESQAFYKRLL